MNPTKIQFSADELAIVQNAEILLTKNRVIEKIQASFHTLSVFLETLYKNKLGSYPLDLAACRPGITKGEKLKGLPWVVLDFPRHFDSENIFALRTIFWWGHDLIITLHLKGKFLESGIQKIVTHRAMLIEKRFVVCIDGYEWEHDLQSDHVLPIGDIDSIDSAVFLKLSVTLPLNTLNEDLPEKLQEMHMLFATILTD